MSKKNNSKAETRVEGVEHALTRAEQFIEIYQKQITIVIGILLGIALLYMGFQHLYIKKKASEAATQMFPAERYYENEQWDQALNGDGNNPGFIEIMEDYRFTPSANLARYYAGISSLQLGEYDDAIKYLGKFKSKDKILSNLAYGGIGDAYAQLNEYNNAVKFYLKAASHKSNDFTSPMYLFRAGVLLEKEAKYKEALNVYNQIKNDYATSIEGQSIEKYITRVQLKEGK